MNSGSSENGIWHIVSGHGQEKTNFVKFQKLLYRKIELKTLYKNDIKIKHWKRIVIEVLPF